MGHCCTSLPNFIVLQLIELEEAQEAHMRSMRGGYRGDSSAGEWRRHLEITEELMEKQTEYLEQNGGSTMTRSAKRGGTVTEEHATQELYDMKCAWERKWTANWLPDMTAGTLPGTRLGEDFIHDAFAKTIHEQTEIVWQFYKRIFSVNSLDDRGMTLISSINYGVDYANAFWSPTSQMVYGNGGGKIDTTALDVIGHEMTHGFLEKKINLTYRGQSGAIDESIADIFGIMVKQWNKNQTVGAANWLFGEKHVPSGKTLRSFTTEAASPFDLQPKNVVDMEAMVNSTDALTKRRLQVDHGGVHMFSGIPNHAFYLFCTALGASTHSWETGGKVWFKTVTEKTIDNNSTFEEFAKLTIEAATEINRDWERHLKTAWTTVGVLAPPVSASRSLNSPSRALSSRSKSPYRSAYDGPSRNAYDSPNRNAYEGPNRNAYDGPSRNAYDSPNRNAYDSPNRNTRQYW